jgi:peptidoglycan/xylan/chitin deacetylase (PgdA/CDA1 family)
VAANRLEEEVSVRPDAAADWHKDSDADAVERRVLEGIRARDDSIVLMHSWPDSTAEALPRILDGLVAEGAELVDVATLKHP